MTTQPGRPDWAQSKIYAFLYDSLPEWRTQRNILDVPRIAVSLNVSKERVYKILRSGHMPAKHARSLHEDSKLQCASAPPLSAFYEFVS